MLETSTRSLSRLIYEKPWIRLVGLATAIILSGCTTTLDPAKVCTAEWIKPRATSAVQRIETRLEKTLSTLRSVADDWMNGEDPGSVKMFRLSNAFNDLERELETGDGIRDLRMLSRTCDDPDLIRNEVQTLLAKEGLPAPVIGFLESAGILDRIIATAEGDVRKG